MKRPLFGQPLRTAESDGAEQFRDIRTPQLAELPDESVVQLLQLWSGWEFDAAGELVPLTPERVSEIRSMIEVDPIQELVNSQRQLGEKSLEEVHLP